MKKAASFLFAVLLTASAFCAGQEPVLLEDMTWTEVREAVQAGKNIAIVPTGGTEQNGPHMVLGKHNYIVRYTGEKIAESLGNALVAPVVAYVPEGDSAKKTGHMAYAGTISVPDPVFKETLKAAARSLFAHGFKVVCFVGDSGGNQAAQDAAARELNREFSASGQKALNVSDYYSQNGQTDFLKTKGFSIADIGTHASIRDTSELMTVHAGGIRTAKLKKNGGAASAETGVYGDPEKASASLGEVLLQLKIAAAVRQIKTFTTNNRRS